MNIFIKLILMFKQLHIDYVKEAVQAKIKEVFEGKTKEENPGILQTALNSDYADSTCFYQYVKSVIKMYYTSDKGGSARALEANCNQLKNLYPKRPPMHFI